MRRAAMVDTSWMDRARPVDRLRHGCATGCATLSVGRNMNHSKEEPMRGERSRRRPRPAVPSACLHAGRLVAFCLAIPLSSSLMTGPAVGQVFDPNFQLSFTEGVTGTTGSVQTVDCLLDITPTAVDLAGWTFGVCHDPLELAPLSATPPTSRSPRQTRSSGSRRGW